MKSMIVLFVLMFLTSLTLEAKMSKVKLEKDEKRFKVYYKYALKDFNLAWKVNAFQVIYEYTLPYDGKVFKFPEKLKFSRILKVGDIEDTRKNNKDSIWLINAILKKKEYFWKEASGPENIYKVTTLMFMDESKRFKAIETLQEIKEMLGPIDTEGELFLWIYATTKNLYAMYSYKKVGDLYRVRFTYTDGIHFKYYDQNGDMVKTEKTDLGR